MKGNPEVIAALNDILVGELTAINQYFLHAKMCKNWGYLKLAEIIRRESIDEMKHADELADRILLLEGMPNFQALNKMRIGETVAEQLQSDLHLEIEAVARLRKAIDLCVQHRDYGSRELVEKILVDEEEHLDWLEAQLQIVEDIGVENYLAQNIYP